MTDSEGLSRRALTFLIAFAGVVFGYALISVLPHEAADEGFHTPQIWEFYNHHYTLSDNLAMIPFYHYVMATVVRQIGVFDIDLIRFLSLAVSLLILPVFYSLTRLLRPQAAETRWLQFFFLPLLFPFFFLIYTDVWALLAILYAIVLALQRRYLLSATLGLIAVLLKQTNVLWLGFAFVLVLFEDPSLLSTLKDNWLLGIRTLVTKCLRHGWPYLVVFGLFGLFVYYNHGVAMGDRALQQAHFNPTNLYFFLICAWAVFLPSNLENLPAVFRLLRKPLVVAALVAGFFIYLGTYSNTHQYNQPGLSFYLRNRLLDVMTRSVTWRAVLYLPAAWMLLSLAAMRLPEKRYYWLYLFIPLSIVFLPLIEVRYYFSAFALLLAVQPACRPTTNFVTLSYYLCASSFLVYSIAMQRFFI